MLVVVREGGGFPVAFLAHCHLDPLMKEPRRNFLALLVHLRLQIHPLAHLDKL